MGDTRQIQREELQQKVNMKSLEKAVSGYKMLDTQEYAFQATREEAWTREKRNASLGRFGFAYLPDNERGLLTSQDSENAMLYDDVSMMDKKRKKKRDQEQDATRRAGKNNFTYAARQLDPRGTVKDSLKAARGTIEMPDESEALEAYDSVATFESPLVCLTFSRVPTQREISEMLAARNKLAIYLKRAPKELNVPDADLIIAQKKEMYQKLDDALQTYYTAHGVDFKTGQDLSGKKVGQARQHLALAVENFEEAFGNQISDLAEARLNKMRKDKNFQRRLKEITGADIAKMKSDGLPAGTAAQTDSPGHNALVHIRQLIIENPESYAANKVKINQLFAELTNCANTASSINRQMDLAIQMLEEAHDEGTSAEALRRTKNLPNTRDSRRNTSLLRQITRLESALNYFLTGQEPEMFDEALFLQNRFQLETSTYNNYVGPKSEIHRETIIRTRASATALAKAEQEAAEAGEENVAVQRKVQKMRTLNEGSLSEKLLAVSYEDSFKHAENLIVAPISAQKQEASPTDYQEAMAQCLERKKDFRDTSLYLHKLRTKMGDTLQQYTGELQNAPLLTYSNELVDYNHIGTLNNYINDVVSRKKPLDPALINEVRELEANMVRAIKVKKEEKKAKRLAKKKGVEFDFSSIQVPLVYFTDKQPPMDVTGVLQGYQEELELYETAKADIEAFIQEHKDAFKANLTPKERMANYSAVYLVGQKAKELESRVGTFRNSPFYANISKEDQQRLPDFDVYFRGLKEYANLYARVINSYDTSAAPTVWNEADLYSMSLNLSDYHVDHLRRISG